MTKAASKTDLRKEILALRRVGAQMANLCFNLGQNADPMDLGKMVSGPNLCVMYDLSKRWDAVNRSEDPHTAAECRGTRGGHTE